MPRFKLTFLHTVLLFALLSFIFQPIETRADSYPELNAEQISWIGEQIYKNECNQKPECLTAWNTGEDFPSIGIGHFIWYRADQKEVYEESFPDLLAYFESHSIKIPSWLVTQSYNASWRDREHFLAEFNNPALSELRLFLLETISAQTEFIIQRFEAALDKIMIGRPAEEQRLLEDRFLQIANTAPPYGLYALIDYVNFKGEGSAKLEQYNNQGWGLRQVLENMPDNSLGEENHKLQQFVDSARQVLARRVANAPAERNEARWLQGWSNRLDTYLPPTKKDIEKE